MKIRVSMQGKKRGENPVGQVCSDRNCWFRALVKGGKRGWETFEQRVPYSASAWFSWKAVSSQQWKNQTLQLLTCSSLDPQVHLTCSPTPFLLGNRIWFFLSYQSSTRCHPLMELSEHSVGHNTAFFNGNF